jgi:rubredoxin
MSGKMKCKVCGYIYDPEKGEPRNNIKPDTEWENIPENFHCPSCGAPKKMFLPL